MSPKPKRTPRERRPRTAYNPRPFAGEAFEADLVALREVVPSATAELTLKAGGTVTIATVLPLGWSAMVRQDKSIVVALQVAPRSGDVGIDLGQALSQALASDPGAGLGALGLPEEGTPTLADLIEPGPWDVVVHDGFDWWITDEDRANVDDEVEASMQRANAAVVPTVRLGGVEAAYWCQIGDRSHLRWVLTGDEERNLDALARLHAADQLALGEGTRFIGTFRALGVIVPVWDLVPGTSAEDTEGVAAEWLARFTAAQDGGPLTADEKRSRAGVVSRQLTLR